VPRPRSGALIGTRGIHLFVQQGAGTNRSARFSKVAARARNCGWNHRSTWRQGTDDGLVRPTGIFSFDVAENLGHETKIGDTRWSCASMITGLISGSKMASRGSVSDQPNNPAVLITIRGRGVPTVAGHSSDRAWRRQRTDHNRRTADDAGVRATEAPNRLTSVHGLMTERSLTSSLLARTVSPRAQLELNKPLTTGWADWQLVVDKTMPHAERWMDFQPAELRPRNYRPKTCLTGCGSDVEQDGRYRRAVDAGRMADQAFRLSLTTSWWLMGFGNRLCRSGLNWWTLKLSAMKASTARLVSKAPCAYLDR
jgi:hypothetical protein